MALQACLIPQPGRVSPAPGHFTLRPDTAILISPASDALYALGEQLAQALLPSVARRLPVRAFAGAADACILLRLGGDAPDLGAEGYHLTCTRDAIEIAAAGLAGLFYGGQTLQQALALAGEPGDAVTPAPAMPCGVISDAPRYPWRGMMLDVARHFFAVSDIKRLIDLLAQYKLNRLHLHLTDDQGWRIEIKSWPRLAEYGGVTAVGGGPGGFYTQADYTEIVRYAAERHITVVPEIDLPGHTMAALASYPELNPNGQAPARYTGIEVGMSSLWIGAEITARFVRDVLLEVAALTPGPYLHVGGDEAHATDPNDYMRFIAETQALVRLAGKQMVGWAEVARSPLQADSIAQFWSMQGAGPALALAAAHQGAAVIFSPAHKAYLDMKYDPTMPLGLTWAGCVDVRSAYEWDPVALLPGFPAERILGVEAALWTETIVTFDDLLMMALPRLVGLAEVGWTPAVARAWDAYQPRLAAHEAWWQARGISSFQWSVRPQVAKT